MKNIVCITAALALSFIGVGCAHVIHPTEVQPGFAREELLVAPTGDVGFDVAAVRLLAFEPDVGVAGKKVAGNLNIVFLVGKKQPLLKSQNVDKP